MIEDIYFVTSLPRTGTTSICEMATICNYKSLHVLTMPLLRAIDEGYRFFADTPFYNHEFLLGLLENNTKYNYKFIYINRDDVSWLTSINARYKTWKPNLDFDSLYDKKINILDKLCHRSIKKIPSIPSEHKIIMKNICYMYNIPILEYEFSDGWEPFCKFINTAVPINTKIPHRNTRL